MLHAVDQAYRQFDDDRAMLERSLDLSSQELLQANTELRALVSAFPDQILRLDRDGIILDVKGAAHTEPARGWVIDASIVEVLDAGAVPRGSPSRREWGPPPRCPGTARPAGCRWPTPR